MSSSTSSIVLKSLNDATVLDNNTALKQLNASAPTSGAVTLEIGFNDFMLLTLIVLCANIGFKLLETLLDGIIHLMRKETKNRASKDTL